MCNNGYSTFSNFNIEDIINLRKSIAKLTVEESEKLDLQTARKFFLRGKANRLKSRSDSDLRLSDDYKNFSRCTDFEVSSFPSESDITVIRVLKRSKVHGTPSRALEGILGDGSHLPESLSMVNLATLVQGLPTFCIEERLIPLSSWDSPIVRTASDTTMQSAFAQLQANSSLNFDNNRFFPKHIVAKLAELVTNGRNSSIILDTDLNEEISISGHKLVTGINIIDDEIEFTRDKTVTNNRREKLFTRLTARIQKTFRGAFQCFCFPAVDRRDKNKLDSN